MALPHAPEARRFYQVARQRYEDAQYLLEAERTTGAIYLAGYGIECMLKALVLSILARWKRVELLASFRGSRAHDFDWLMSRYFRNGGQEPPNVVAEALSLAKSWTVEIRYEAKTASETEATEFMEAAEKVMSWADGRM